MVGAVHRETGRVVRYASVSRNAARRRRNGERVLSGAGAKENQATPPSDSRPLAGRRKPRWGWWVLAAVVVVAVGGYLARANIERGPSTPPVAVDEEAAGTHTATLDEAVRIAHDVLARMDAELIDYTGRIVKRERVRGKLGDETEMLFKIRTSRPASAGGSAGDGQPMSVYLKFLKPKSTAGREVIWVEGRNEGNLIAHEGGIFNLARVHLNPTGLLAMRGSLYPISEIGFQNLVRQLIRRSEMIAKAGGAEVTFVEDHTFDGRPCLLIQVRPHATAVSEDAEVDPAIDFWLAEVVLDTERGVPLRYAAYGLPEKPGEEPPLLEEYAYHDVQLNVGLSDADFDPDNPEYNYP